MAEPPNAAPPDAATPDAATPDAATPDAATPDAGDAGLDGLWQRVLEAWDGDESHAALLDFGLRARALPEVAARYRALAGDPEKGERARRKLDGVAAAATNLMFATRSRRHGRVPRSLVLSAFGTCAALLAWLAWALWGSR